MIPFVLILAIAIAACSRAPSSGTTAPSPSAQVFAAAPTASATAVVPVTANTASANSSGAANTPSAPFFSKGANSCALINSNDLAHLFPPHNEIVRGDTHTGQVTHPPFSQSLAEGVETSCLYYDFHQPGVQTGWMYQVTYRIDVPTATAIPDWNQAWAAAKAAGQPIHGLGDDAFASGANLYIKTGNAYLTFESVDTHVDSKTPAGQQQILADEQQLAQAALVRLNP